MDVSALKAQIKSNTISNVLIFTGDEWAVQDIYIKQIAKVTGKEVQRVERIAEVASRLKSNSFLKKDYIYIARDDTEYMQSEKLQSLVNKVIGNNTFILLLTSVDKRTKFYKAYSDAIINFEPLKPQVLKKYIQKEIALSDESCDKLMEVCEYDYGRCLLEIDKIHSYRNSYDAQSPYPDDVFRILLEDGTINTPPKDAIFDFIDAILDRKIKCFDLYEQCKAVGEATMVMLSVLYNNAKAVLQVQSCKSNDIGKTTGLTGWQIMNAKKHIGNYRNGELVNLLRLCTDCEQGIKTGRIDEQFVMDYILVSVL